MEFCFSNLKHPLHTSSMVVFTLPLLKLCLLGMRQLARPISSFISKEAKQSQLFRKYICVPPAQCFHWCEVTLKMVLLNLGRPIKVEPLNETIATELGAEILGELIVFSIAAAGLIFETKRQANKRDLERESVNVHSMNLIEATKVLEYRQKIQNTYIREIAHALTDLNRPIKINQLERKNDPENNDKLFEYIL